jgi:hypothetical protein
MTSAGVGVGIGKPRIPDPGTSQADRRTMEVELREKGLPEGNAMAPVAGFICILPFRKKASETPA